MYRPIKNRDFLQKNLLAPLKRSTKLSSTCPYKAKELGIVNASHNYIFIIAPQDIVSAIQKENSGCTKLVDVEGNI